MFVTKSDILTVEIMKKITAYCDKEHIKGTFSRRDYMLPGHCIDIPNTVFTTDRFEIIFEFENVSMLYIAESIMNGSSYTDTLGEEYNIGTIVRQAKNKSNGYTYVENQSASNLCKVVYPDGNAYIFGCWI